MKRILTIALSVVLLLAMLLTDVGAIAVDFIYEEDPKTKKPTDEVNYEETVKQYLTLEFKTPEDKLATMTMKYGTDDYQLWVDELTGEVATKDLKSGQILFSNPYDIGANYENGKGPSESTKKNIFSQVIIKYDDNGTDKTMYSFEEAAMRGQIRVKNIKGGVRVEYSIGREETRMLVPRVIEKNSFETRILDVFAAEVNAISREKADEGMIELDWHDYKEISKRNSASTDSGNSLWFYFMQLFAYYQLKAESECSTERERLSMFAAYPITKSMDVYVFDPNSTQTEIIKVEGYIKTYCPSYTFEQLEIDHTLTQYEGSDKNPALFKLSLEYMLDDKGMSVRCPANGLRFNEALYQLTYMSLLPYMGAGANHLLGNPEEKFTGYNFFPDGSGTIFRHEELAGTTATTINAKVYGFDYAYNEISGNHAETVRYPVFGIVSNYHDTRIKTEEKLVSEEVKDTEGNVIAPAEYETVDTKYTYTEDRGFVAIIEEGDALAELSTYHEGALSKYNSVRMMFYPRPKDSYNLANAISVGANATWTVVSERKYVGNYKIRYIMLTDAEKAKENDIKDSYEVSWMGMAQAYRDYLYDKGELKALEEKDVKEDIPAYIETFGATETVEKILSIPVNVMTPLASFENVKTMYDELSEAGVKNIKFKLTGYANGGMNSSIPYKLKFEKAVGGNDGFEDLVQYAKEKDFEVFPDFDFAYVRASSDSLFDGLTIKKHIVKSINNTYMSKRYYSATRQTMMGRFELAVSAAYYSHFYEKLNANLLKYYKDGARSAISVATLGNALNSDFDEDEPYNREDTKKSTVKALNVMSETYDDVMTESGNAYTWKYVDYILNLPLDSSRYARSAASVPFIGVVLHGSKQFTGSPLNMEGNIGYSLLKAIENGAGLYFVLCFQNYNVLKESNVLSQYYSVRYEILKEDVVKYYNLVNDLTKDLQTSRIASHEFLIGERVPDADELEADKLAEKIAAEQAEKAAQEYAERVRTDSLLNGRVTALTASQKTLENVMNYYKQASGFNEGGVTADPSGTISVYTGMQTLVDRVLAATEAKKSTDAVKEAAEKEKNYYASLTQTWNAALSTVNGYLTKGRLKAYQDLIAANTTAAATLATTENNIEAKKSAMDEALQKTLSTTVSNIPSYVSTYDAATTDEAKQNALDKINLFAGNLDTARRFVALKEEVIDETSKLEKFEKAYLESDEYKALQAAIVAAEEVYSSAKAANADKISTRDYIAAEKKLASAKAELTAYIEMLEIRIANCNKKMQDFKETEKEYTMLLELRTEAEAEYLALTQGGEDAATNSYAEAVAAAEAALEAMAPEVGAAKKALEEAERKLAEYEANYLATYQESPDYKAVENKKIAAENELALLTSQLETASPAIPALADMTEALLLRDEKNAAKSTLEYGYLNTPKYKELRATADKAAADFAEIADRLENGMESDATYKTYKKAYEDAKAALEVFTLGYLTNEDYQPLGDAEAKASSAIHDFVYAYEKEDEYKTLKAASDAANKEYDTVMKGITFTQTAGMDQATYEKLKKAVEAKAKADAELNAYTEVKEAEALKSADYKKLVSQYNTAKAAVDNYVSIFIGKLQIAAEDSKKAKHPEETEGGKYALADKAFTEAENNYLYYIGEKKVPTTNKTAKVYANEIKNNAEYKAAQDAKTAAETACTNYKNEYATQIKYTKEEDIAKITDPDVKAVNAQYQALNAEYEVAATRFNETGTALRNIDSSLYTAASSYASALATRTMNNGTLSITAKNLEVTALKADDAAIREKYNLPLTAAEEAAAKADSTAIVYNEAAAAAKTANDAQASAISAVRTQNVRVDSLADNLLLEVNNIKQNLADSNLAVELMGNDTTYSQSLRDTLKESNAQIKAIEQQIHEYSDKIIVAAKAALTASSKILDVDVEFPDPYAEKATETETKTVEEKTGYKITKYTDNSGNIVRVGYESGVVFYLNYNYFAVTTVYDGTTYEIPAYGVIRINADGTACEARTASRVSAEE